jgi:hypothetical protein
MNDKPDIKLLLATLQGQLKAIEDQLQEEAVKASIPIVEIVPPPPMTQTTLEALYARLGKSAAAAWNSKSQSGENSRVENMKLWSIRGDINALFTEIVLAERQFQDQLKTAR